MNRVKVTVHGELAQVLGKSVWHFCIEKPFEVFAALEANTSKLFRYLFENPDSEYKVLIDGGDLHHLGELNATRPMQEVHVIPVLAGAGRAGGWLALIGIVIIAAVIIIASAGTATPAVGAAAPSLFATATAGWSGFALALGVTLTLTGVSQMIMKSPSFDDSERPENKPSYVFNGAVNSYRQGNPIPVGFGRLRVGSQIISAGIRSVDLLPSVT